MYYEFKNSGEYPFQFGNGTYVFTLFEHRFGTTWKQIEQKSVRVDMKNPDNAYLKPNTMVPGCIEADEIVHSMTNTLDEPKTKVIRITDYVRRTIQYDTVKA